jgi:hypothetical protein
MLYIQGKQDHDQKFGDILCNGAPLHLSEIVSPNHHALAEQYVLLDNSIARGQLDGHSWHRGQ